METTNPLWVGPDSSVTCADIKSKSAWDKNDIYERHKTCMPDFKKAFFYL